MNKKTAFAFVVFLAALFFTFSCTKKSDGPSPDKTPQNTATVTVTATQTSTNSPTPVLVDNFEDNDAVTSVICSDCTNSILQAVSIGVSYFHNGCVALSAAPFNLGSYAYSMTCTAVNDGNAWYMLNFQTFSVTDTGSDFSAYNRVNLTYKVNTNAALADDIQMNVTLSDPTQNHRLEKNNISLNRTGTWQTLSLDLYTFTVESAALNAAQILGQVAGIRVYIHSAGDGLGTAHIETTLDNITLSAE